MTVIDSVSKTANFIPIHIIITIERIAWLFLYYVWKLHSLLTCVILDKGLQFIVFFTKELYYLLRVEIVLPMA